MRDCWVHIPGERPREVGDNERLELQWGSPEGTSFYPGHAVQGEVWGRRSLRVRLNGQELPRGTLILDVSLGVVAELPLAERIELCEATLEKPLAHAAQTLAAAACRSMSFTEMLTAIYRAYPPEDEESLWNASERRQRAGSRRYYLADDDTDYWESEKEQSR